MKNFNSRLPRKLSGPSSREAGFTLIEMMVSITIGLAIIAGLLTVMASGASNSKTNERTSELLTNGRYALNSIKQEFRQSGYRAYTWPKTDAMSTAMGALTNECLQTGAAAASFVSNIRQGVWGANNSNPFSANCIPAANYASDAGGVGEDVLVARRLDDLPLADADLVANRVYFRSSYAKGEIFRGTVVPTFDVALKPVANFKLQTYVYYISPYTTAANENPKVPALYRVALSLNGMEKELVASGIEHFQVQYGQLSTVPDTRYFDSLPGTSSDNTPTDWDSVDSVRIWLLARNATPEPGYANTSSYVMGDKTFAVNDGYRRQLFTTVVQLRN